MSDYKNPRPSPSANASDPCVVYDNSVSFDKLINESEVVTTYKGIELQSVPSLLEQIESEASVVIQSIGWDPVGEFATGFTYTKLNDVGRDVSGSWWRYNGSDLPKVIASGTVPSSPNFSVISFETADNVPWKPAKSVGWSLDDLQGFTSELYARSGIVDDGQQDYLGNSKRFDALDVLFQRKNSINPLEFVGLTDTEQVQAALNTGRPVFLSSDFDITATLDPMSCKLLHGNGKLKVSSDISIITARTPAYNNLKIAGIVFQGTGLATALDFLGTAIGGGAVGVRVTGCEFSRFKIAIDSAWQLTTTHAAGLSVQSCDISLCQKGVVLRTGSEFCTVSNSSITECSEDGVLVYGGNNKVVDNVICNNGYGVRVVGGGGNDSHGTISDNMINHNSLAGLCFDSITQGMIVDSNQLYNASEPVSTYGAVLFLNCSGDDITFSSNKIDGNFTFSGTNTFKLNDFGNTQISGTMLYVNKNRMVTEKDNINEPWAASITPFTGDFTSVSIVNAEYTQIGAVVWYSINFSIVNAGTGSGGINISTPIGLPPVGFFAASGINMSNGKALIGTASSLGINMTYYDATNPIVNTHPYSVSGFYYIS